MPVKIKI